MTLDESFQVARERLSQQGQLLNGQLLKLLDGDKDAFREVRARLISEGFAEDRFGVGLGRLESAPVADVPPLLDHSVNESASGTERSADNQSNAAANTEWYLMASGLIQGPMTFDALCEMRSYGEIQPADVVRTGAFGFWQRPDDVPELAAIKPNQRKRSPRILAPESPREESLTPSAAIRGIGSPGSKPASDESGFFFWESGRSIGPVSRTELLDRLKAGRLSRDEFVRVGIDGEWQPVSAIIAETNLVSSSPPNQLFESSNEPALQLDHDSDLRQTDFRSDSPRTTSSSRPAYEPVARKQASPSNLSQSPAPARTAVDRRQRNDHAPSSLSDVDIEQPDAKPRSDLPTTPAPASTKRSPTTRPATTPSAPSAEPSTARFRLSTSTINDLWRRASRLVGSEKRLKGLLMAVAIVCGIGYWLRQPPSASSIYEEFNRYHGQITELKSRGVNDQAQWKRDVARAISRTQALVTGLKDPRTGASSLRPAKQELLWAGQDSLLKLLESPNLDVQTAKGFEEQFEYHMSQARRLIDGGTRAVPQEFAVPTKRPDASGPPRRGAGPPSGPPSKPATAPRP